MPSGPESGPGEALSQVLRLYELGWQVVPAPHRGKSPKISWKKWATERAPERLVREWFAVKSNVFLITGAVSMVCVLDCDDQVAYDWWKARLAAEGVDLDATARVKTGNGWHFYFRLKPGQRERGRSSDGQDGTGKWDLRAEGGGVVAPPSTHPTGRLYEWVDGHGPDAMLDAPAQLFERADGEESDEAPRSMLTHLLQNPPAEGGRNNWLARVAGHYAAHIPHRDAFEQMVRDAGEKLTPALPEAEVVKMLESIWTSERAKEGKAAPDLAEDGADAWRADIVEAREDTGWLVSGGNRIMVQARTKDAEGETETTVAPWLDCDIRVLGVVEGEAGHVYSVELRFPDDRLVEDHLPARVISDTKALNGWLASHGASIGPPDEIWPKTMQQGARLLRYLKAQGAETMLAADALGWHHESKAFITHDGLIRATGPAPFEHVRPDPGIRGWAPYKYGHAGHEEARAVLREVLSFHDERVAAVYGAWWAATLLKPQITDRVSQFPFMALEASSESGKTTGMFPMMLQLAGNTAGQNNPTRAALRDYLSAHWSGIVWVDDLDNLDELGELLRNVTVGGSMVKKGDGNHAQVVAQLRGALVVSGESLGLRDQKALIDRAVLLDVPSPTQRKSKHGDYPQWDDIVDLKVKHPDLSAFAGSLVELALQQTHIVEKIKDLRVGPGRHADTLAIVRAGARVLSNMAGGANWIVTEVDAWAEGEAGNYSGAENTLTLKLLPRALQQLGWPKRPVGPSSPRDGTTPTFADSDGVVWFSPKLLAEWWEMHSPPGRAVSARTESQQALEQQARELGLGGGKGVGRKDFRLATGEGTVRYWKATEEISDAVLARSRSED